MMRNAVFSVIGAFTLTHLATYCAKAVPCFPNDPDAANLENICPNVLNPNQFPNAFIQGEARPVTTIPTIRQPQGSVLIKPTGFWTGVQTTDTQRTVTTSTGESYTLNK